MGYEMCEKHWHFALMSNLLCQNFFSSIHKMYKVFINSLNIFHFIIALKIHGKFQ